jgi:hypothetical protein
MCSEGRVAAGAPVPDLLSDRQPGDGVLRHLRAPRGRRRRLHVAHRPARRQRGVARQHDVRRRLRHRHLDTHTPRHGFGVQGDHRQLEAREPSKNQLIDRWSFHPFLRFVLPIPSL